MTITSGSLDVVTLTTKDLEGLIDDLRGDDLRLMRWDATKHTKKRQNDGACESLQDALAVISSSSSTARLLGLACEYATFCVTNNHKQRSRLSEYNGIHSSIVKLVSSKNTHTSAMASHLIYIATFANGVNHQGFINAGAVKKLAAVVKNSKASQVQIMWAAAALQNLAASYCDTEGDGRCYWKWRKSNGEFSFELYSNKYTMNSDGEAVRQEMLGDQELVRSLIGLACRGPVGGEMTSDNPFVGENAIVGTHDEASSIVAWAAAGALKNLAIAAEARPMIEASIKCLCRLAHSPDWLEENKGEGAISHLRPSDPCWFQDDNAQTGKLCVDHVFLDEEDYTCSDYGKATKQECLATDKNSNSAKEACCGCGGGDPEASWSMTTKRRSEL
ncbi:hypothetical protein MHU86_10568 [Fragilaria crotonensis]|nr:hypothetical protein MHU86_10568 [Fragilaria crotonensis]